MDDSAMKQPLAEQSTHIPAIDPSDIAAIIGGDSYLPEDGHCTAPLG